MSSLSTTSDQLRKQITTASKKSPAIEAVELKIASALLQTGRYTGQLNEDELAAVIKNIVYVRFANQKVGGLALDIVHNVPTIDVKLSQSQAVVSFLVHIHKPIIAFLQFRYVLINDPYAEGDDKRIRLKKGTLSIKKDTRRFDLKAKAALAAFDVERIASKELIDLAGIIDMTLRHRMNGHGIVGKIKKIQLQIEEKRLNLELEGDFKVREPKIAAN